MHFCCKKGVVHLSNSNWTLFPSDSGTTEPNLFEFLFIHQSEETFKSEKQNGSNGAFLENICFKLLN